MWNLGALRRAGLGGADFELAIHRNRIAVDDFTVEAASECQRQRSFAARRWTEHNGKQRFTRNQRQRMLQLMYDQ